MASRGRYSVHFADADYISAYIISPLSTVYTIEPFSLKAACVVDIISRDVEISDAAIANCICIKKKKKMIHKLIQKKQYNFFFVTKITRNPDSLLFICIFIFIIPLNVKHSRLVHSPHFISTGNNETNL